MLDAVRGAGLRVFDLGSFVVAFPASYHAYEYVVSPRPGLLGSMDSQWPAMALGVVAWAASSWIHGVYDAPIGRSRWAGVGRLARAFGLVVVVLAATAFAQGGIVFSPPLVAPYFGCVLTLLVASRLVHRFLVRVAARGHAARRYAVVGSGAVAREIVEAVGGHPEWGLRFAGFVRPDDAVPDFPRERVLGRLSELSGILEHEVLDVMIFAVPRERLEDVERGVHLCKEQGVEVRISLDVLRFGPGRMTVANMDGVPVLAFTRTPSNAIALAAKRTFDVIVSALVLLFLSPLLAAIALAIRTDSRGPILFRQRRVGRNGRAFLMLKFRSMYRDAEARLEALRVHNEMSGPVFKMTNDPRVTRVGRFLRRTSLDELPQFWNVLRGDMSVVGPRPPLPAEVRQYKRWQRRRLSVRPGITCIWQISGRNQVDFERWMDLDLEYIDRWSLWKDLEICVKTIPAVLSARGAR